MAIAAILAAGCDSHGSSTAAGTDFTVIDFTDSGSSKCTLYGFLGVPLTNSSGAQIGATATRNPAKASTLITLAPGGKANATLGVANAENYPASACKPTAAAHLKVFPSNQTQPIEVAFHRHRPRRLGHAPAECHRRHRRPGSDPLNGVPDPLTGETAWPRRLRPSGASRHLT